MKSVGDKGSADPGGKSGTGPGLTGKDPVDTGRGGGGCSRSNSGGASGGRSIFFLSGKLLGGGGGTDFAKSLNVGPLASWETWEIAFGGPRLLLRLRLKSWK